MSGGCHTFDVDMMGQVLDLSWGQVCTLSSLCITACCSILVFEDGYRIEDAAVMHIEDAAVMRPF